MDQQNCTTFIYLKEGSCLTAPEGHGGSRLSGSLSVGIKETVLTITHIISHLNQCNAYYMELSLKRIQRLQYIYTVAAQVILRVLWHSYSPLAVLTSNEFMHVVQSSGYQPTKPDVAKSQGICGESTFTNYFCSLHQELTGRASCMALLSWSIILLDPRGIISLLHYLIYGTASHQI